jgi:hypothetical protein
VDGNGPARAIGIIEAARVAAEREAVEAAEAERLLAETRAATTVSVEVEGGVEATGGVETAGGGEGGRE